MSSQTTLPDIQQTIDLRAVRIDRVGVTGIRMPVRLLRKTENELGLPGIPQMLPSGHLDTVGEFELAVSLPSKVKGTHMSRFTEVLNSYINDVGTFSHADLQNVAAALATKLEADSVFIKLTADYFVIQAAPATGKPGTAPLKGILIVELKNGVLSTSTGVIMEGKTCCPCSREISEYNAADGRGKGAHAQRSTAKIIVRHHPSVTVWFEDLVEIAWKSFSSPVYPVLKRPDERAVTMAAYGNPKFVEDVIRDIVSQLRARIDINGHEVRVQNAESIHYHDAYAEVSS
jgi:GTP cyclohydrolase I